MTPPSLSLYLPLPVAGVNKQPQPPHGPHTMSVSRNLAIYTVPEPRYLHQASRNIDGHSCRPRRATGTARHDPAGHDSPLCCAGQYRRADGQARCRAVLSSTVALQGPLRHDGEAKPALPPALVRWQRWRRRRPSRRLRGSGTARPRSGGDWGGALQQSAAEEAGRERGTAAEGWRAPERR